MLASQGGRCGHKPRGPGGSRTLAGAQRTPGASKEGGGPDFTLVTLVWALASRIVRK